MGRPSLSEEEIKRNKSSIIRNAMEIINEEGIQSVSARTLGARTGMNSALIYRYFKDIDEVILFACVHALQDYNLEMTSSRNHLEDLDNKDLYTLSWEIFSKHAFNRPEEYRILFFSRHSNNLPNVIKEYYNLFPEEKAGNSDIILQGMYRTANLRSRNLMLLIPVLEGKKTQDEIIMLNDITISYFYLLLIQLLDQDSNLTPEEQSRRLLKGCQFLVDL